MRGRVDHRNSDTVAGAIDQYSLMTLTQCVELSVFHLVSLVGVKTEDIFTSLL